MEDKINERVPLFRSWKNWYAFVILFLAALIVFFSFFTKYFA
jgi:hypothetical protein